MQPRNLVLILTSDLADKLATAMFVVDHEGTLLYFNERAADSLGRTFGDTGRLPADEWATMFDARHPDGRPMAPAELPLVRAITERQPSHLRFRITGTDGQERDIAVTAFPLFSHPDEFVGAAAIFWEEGLVGGAE
jgi:PAS domain-containing protein